jgi:hypothetical protein
VRLLVRHITRISPRLRRLLRIRHDTLHLIPHAPTAERLLTLRTLDAPHLV